MSLKINKNYESFDEVLRDFLDKSDKERSIGRDNDWWWASSLGLCRRKHYFRRLGVPTSNKKLFRYRFVGRDGTAGHDWREAAATSMGVVVGTEVEFKDKKLKVKGRADLLIWLKPGLTLVDIKTQRSEAFWRRKKKKEENKIEPHQKMQLATYFYFLKKKYPKLKEARIYYVDRGGGDRDEYILRFDTRMFRKVLGEIRLLNYYWKVKKYPPCQKTWECNYCNFKTFCKKVDKEGLTPDKITKIIKPKNNGKQKRNKLG